ncbi:hypothetical protein V5735_18155 (plasmid) [Haladaptatus sp. SPP-AMP-3]|uniref:hypothetical protein n=1 Tax=Haladaptatus sp. SPP-AMP-3 TaxID=3121295 RepID=UPI003C2D6F27
MRRALLAAVFAVLLVTAGCNSLVSPDPSPAPETTTTLSGRLAPGLTANGFTDRAKLTEAHGKILREKSYTFRHRVTETDSNGNVLGHVQISHEVGSNSTRFTYDIVQNGSLSPLQTPSSSYELSAWANGTTTLFARTRNEHTSYQLTHDPDSLGYVRRTTNSERLYNRFVALNVTDIKRIDRPGTPAYRVVMNDVRYPSLFPNFDTVENASLIATIDTWGVVRRYRLVATGRKDGETNQLTETFEVTNIGETTIRRPPWYSTAMNATAHQ